MKQATLPLAVLAAALFSPSAHAQELPGSPRVAERPGNDSDDEDEKSGGIDGFFAIGPGMVPSYDGSKKYELVPLMIADVEWKGLALEIRGLGARLDLLGNSPVQIGPVFNFRGKRNSDKDGNGRVKLLNDVDSAMEVGGHVGYRFGGNQYGQGEIEFDLSLVKDVSDGHDGLLGTAQVSYAAHRSQKLFINLDAQTTWADKKYMRAYFGVTPDEATASGLAAYRPGSGIRDIGIGTTIGYQFNQRWGVIARAGANYYVGDAKDSPIVDEGSKIQAVGGLAVSYRF